MQRDKKKKMILYTDHARERMAGRLIKKEWVEEAITNPDRVMDTKYGRKQAIKKIKDDEIKRGVRQRRR